MMDVWTCVAFILMALITGISITSALFCMRERNSAVSRYNKLYEAWDSQTNEIIDLSSDLAAEREVSRSWEIRYSDLIDKPATTLEAPTPEV